MSVNGLTCFVDCLEVGHFVLFRILTHKAIETTLPWGEEERRKSEKRKFLSVAKQFIVLTNYMYIPAWRVHV